MLMSHRGSERAAPARKAQYLVGALIAASLGFGSAQAATFGHSRLVSALGQPLHLEIPVSQLTSQEIDSLRAVPAPAAAWRDAGMTPPVALASMRLVLLDGLRPDTKVIRLQSDQPFDQPVVDVLLDVRSASGQQRYQVSLLAHADTHSVIRTSAGSVAAGGTPHGRSGSSVAGDHAAAGRKIVVRPGDNMFAIANRNSVGGVTEYQLMMALQRANPRAFIEGNVNLVKAGATLVMPGMGELTAISDREARRIFQQHAIAFAKYRQRSGAAAGGVTALSAVGGDVADAPSQQESSDANIEPDTPAQDSGDRLRLSGGPAASTGSSAASTGSSAGSPAGSSTGSSVGSSAGSSANGAGQSGAGSSASVRSGLPDAPSTAGANGAGAAASPDDQAALKKGVEDSRTRIIELEDNVRHLNEALQKQGHVAAEAALEGARSVTEVIKEVIGLTDSDNAAAGDSAASGAAGTGVAGTGVAAGSEAGAAGPGVVPPESAAGGPGTVAEGSSGASSTGPSATGTAAGADGSAAGTNGSAATTAGSAAGTAGSLAGGPAPSTQGPAAAGKATVPSSTSSRAVRELSWFQQNMFAVIGGGLLLIILLVVWLLRRLSASRRDPFESDSPITDAMVREKLKDIDLELDPPPSHRSH